MSPEAKALGANPAHPCNFRTGDSADMKYCDFGMTIHQAFAMAAMQGHCVCASEKITDKQKSAEFCIDMADALCEALSKVGDWIKPLWNNTSVQIVCIMEFKLSDGGRASDPGSWHKAPAPQKPRRAK